MTSADGDIEEEDKAGSKMTLINKANPNHRTSSANHENCIPVAQHRAELDARTAQIALDSEKRLQQFMQEYQERKERDVRAAVGNVRAGIANLEQELSAARADRKRFEDELFSERQAFVSLKSELEEAKDSRKILVQRLEEANENIGRLRDVVKTATARANECSSQFQASQRREAEAMSIMSATQESLNQVTAELSRITDERDRLLDELAGSHKVSEALKQKVEDMTNRLLEQERSFEIKLMAANESVAKSSADAESRIDQRVVELEMHLHSLNEEMATINQKSQADNSLIEGLRQQCHDLEDERAALKREIQQHRKEFGDLARMHRNLSETMNSKLGDERSLRASLEQSLQELQGVVSSKSSQQQEILRACAVALSTLKRGQTELRRFVCSEVESVWRQLQQVARLCGADMQQALVRAVLEESRAWERKSVEEERMWRQRVEQRERAIQDLVSDQREVDQSKLDQMMSKLQAKEEELLQLNRKIADESFRADGFHRTVIALREELDIRRLEQSQLAEQLTSTQRVSMRDADHRQQLEGVASHLRELLRVFRSFVMDVANDFGVPATAIPVFLAGDELTDGLLVSAYEGPLISSLSAVRQCLSERMKATCAIAAQEGAAPLEAELNASKETLRRLIPNAPEANDELARHLPWYVSIARAIEDQLLRLRQEAEDIARGHVSTQLNATAVADEMERLSESHRAVVFEKDTLLRELELQIQAMQKKHAQDMQQQREDLERKTEQLQRRFEKETWKLKEEHQAAVSELNEALEAERKLQTKLKQEALSRVSQPR
ncbi:hypothetical protein PINS_up013188 [Pythium insidiosum]|nr:hypothetical protein PINS_up013188 [Pythium insidiosum]